MWEARRGHRGAIVGDVQDEGQERPRRQSVRAVQEHPGVPTVRKSEGIFHASDHDLLIYNLDPNLPL